MAIKCIDLLAQQGIDVSGVSAQTQWGCFLHDWAWISPEGYIMPFETAVDDGLAHWSDLQ